jgi:hypothetical protein
MVTPSATLAGGLPIFVLVVIDLGWETVAR